MKTSQKIIKSVIIGVAAIGFSGAIYGTGSILGSLVGKAQFAIGNPINASQKQVDDTLIIGARILGFSSIWLFTGVMLGRTVGFYLIEELCNNEILEILREKPKPVVPDQCRRCKYYNWGTQLRCAVQPDLPQDCSDFEKPVS